MTARTNTLFRTGMHDGIAYLDTAPGSTAPTVVLLHSLGADHHMWSQQISELAPSIRVIAPDSRGHGASDLIGPASVTAWVADLARVLDHAQIDAGILVGLSLGGIQAMAFAAEHPERVTALVLADTFAHLSPQVSAAKIRSLTDEARQGGMAAAADSYVRATFTRSPLPPGAEHVRAAMAAMDVEAYCSAVQACFTVDIRSALPAVSAPTLVVWGALDEKTPRPLAETIEHAINEAEFVEVPAAGHLSNLDNADGFTAAVLPFLGDHLDTSRHGERARRHG